MAKVVLLGGLPYSLVNFRGRLIEDLIAAGHEVIGCAAGEDTQTSGQLEAMGARYESVKLERTGLNPLADIESVVDLHRTLCRLRPNALFCYTIKPVIYGSLAGRLAGIPRIHSMITGLGYAFMGNTAKQRLLGMAARALYKVALSNNQGIFFQNRDDRDCFERLGLIRPEQATITGGSGIDLDQFQVQPIPEGPVRFLMCGRILVEKGVREYFAAAKKVKAEFPEAEFTFVGPYDTENPAAINEADLEEMNQNGLVSVHGFTDDVRPFLRDCSVYVLPSYREGTPRTVLEAAAMGRPVITTNSPGGCPQTVQQGESGYLVPVKDSNALADAMIRFLKDPDRIPSMGLAGRRLMEEKFDVKVVNRTIMETMDLFQ